MKSTFLKKHTLLGAFAGTTILITSTVTAATIDPDLLPGKWKDPDAPVHIIFDSDGTYGFQKGGAKSSSPYSKWSLKGDQLTWGKPSGSMKSTILSLDDSKLVIRTNKSKPRTYTRDSSENGNKSASVSRKKKATHPSWLVGTWLEDKYVIFFADGRWGLMRHEEAPLDTKGRRWNFQNGTITRHFPGGKVQERISSMGQKLMVLEDEDGNAHRYRRISASTDPFRKAGQVDKGKAAAPKRNEPNSPTAPNQAKAAEPVGPDIFGIRAGHSTTDVIQLLEKKGVKLASKAGDSNSYSYTYVKNPSLSAEVKLATPRIRNGGDIKSSIRSALTRRVESRPLSDAVADTSSLKTSRSGIEVVATITKISVQKTEPGGGSHHIEIEFTEDVEEEFLPIVTAVQFRQTYPDTTTKEQAEAILKDAGKKYGAAKREGGYQRAASEVGKFYGLRRGSPPRYVWKDHGYVTDKELPAERRTPVLSGFFSQSKATLDLYHPQRSVLVKRWNDYFKSNLQKESGQSAPKAGF